MSTLTRANEWWGQLSILQEPPKKKNFGNALYVPYRHGGAWGLYDASGNIIEESINFVGGYRVASGQKFDRQDPMDFENWSSEDRYVYIGLLNPHFGHFLINSLPRLWWWRGGSLRHLKILCHCPIPLQQLSQFHFISEILAALGIERGALHCEPTRTRIKNIIVPETTFHEQFAVHPMFRELCLEIGMKLLNRESFDNKGAEKLVYLSKSQLKSGVGLIDAEREFESEARAIGCEIVFPEQLSFAQQIDVFSNSKTIIGTLGSALHSSVFCPGGKTIIGLSPCPGVNSNFGLIDCISSNSSHYFYPKTGEIEHCKNENFLTIHRPRDPNKLASDFFHEVRNILTSP